MKKMFKFYVVFGMLSVFCGTVDSWAAAKTTKKQAAIQFGTKVRTRVEASGVYDQNCYNKYYDNF